MLRTLGWIPFTFKKILRMNQASQSSSASFAQNYGARPNGTGTCFHPEHAPYPLGTNFSYRLCPDSMSRPKSSM